MMNRSSRNPAAGGFLIAIGAILGAAIGLARGESTAGFLIGTALGIGGAIAVWLRARA